MKLFVALRTVLALGLGNCARVLWYRILCASGVYVVRLPVGGRYRLGSSFLELVRAPQAPTVSRADAIIAEADDLLAGEMRLFDRHRLKVGVPPNWLASPFDPTCEPFRLLHWSRITEFGQGVDIKAVWELSRFNWTLLFAQAWRLSGDRRYLDALGRWLDHWVEINPANLGLNWRCAQEASIRMLNLLLAGWICGLRPAAAARMQRFVAEHLRRISATLFYARAQDNNHATSESVALLVGGEWLLAAAGDSSLRREAARYARVGRRNLEERVARLVASDGSFAQHSVNYHRMLLDTLSLAQWWCRELSVSGIGATCSVRAVAAIDWLSSMVNGANGDGPNMGGNDGARLVRLSATDYRDHRPSLQLAAALFGSPLRYLAGPWDDDCAWLGIPLERLTRDGGAGKSRCFADGGYLVLTEESLAAKAILRVPRYRFRPAHADALHLDVWQGAVNLARDSGTFSYNADSESLRYFPSTRAHNTVEFDGRDQMPRLGRFLFGDWLQPLTMQLRAGLPGDVVCIGAYRDGFGASHRRTVSLRAGVWHVLDEIEGYEDKAVLRWHLAPGDWILRGGAAESLMGSFRVAVPTGSLRRVEIGSAWESRHYLERSAIPVFEVEVGPGPATLETTIHTVAA